MKKTIRLFLSTVALICCFHSLFILLLAIIGAIGGRPEREFWLMFVFALFWLGLTKIFLYLRNKIIIN